MALTATSTLFGNTVKWGAPSQECVAYFKIYRRADDLTAEVTDKIAEVAWSKNPHLVDLFSNLNNNTAYRYYVRAISYGDKSSALSAKISATVTTAINVGGTATTSINLLGQTISLGGATSIVSMGAESIKVGTACSTVTMEGKTVHCLSTAGFSIGTASTVATINHWRIIQNGNDLEFQRYDSGIWTFKGGFTA